MPVTPTPLPIRFGGGVDTDTESKQVPVTQLLDLQNAVFDKAATLKKRNGYESLSLSIQSAAGDIANARGLASRDDEVILFTDKRAYSHRPSSDEWADTGEVAATTLTTVPVARTGTWQTQPDVAERNGIRVTAWEDSRGGVWCSVFEQSTGRMLLSQQQLDSSTNARNVRCLAVGEVIHVLWTRQDLGFVQLALINPAQPALAPAVSVLVSDLDGARPFYDAEAAPFAPAGSFVRPGIIAWCAPTSPPNILGYKVAYIAPDGTIGSPVSGLPSAVELPSAASTGPLAIAHSPTFEAIGIAAVSGSTRIVTTYIDDLSFASFATFTSPVAAAGYARVAFNWGATLASGTIGGWWCAEQNATVTDRAVLDSAQLDIILGINTHGPVTSLRGHNLVSRAFHDGGPATSVASPQGGDVYVFIAHTVRFFPYVACLRLSDDSGISSPGNTIISRVLPGEASGLIMRPTGPGTRAWSQHLPSVMAVDLADTDQFSRVHAVCVPYRIQLASANGDQFSEQGIKLCTLNCLAPYRAVQFGRGLYLSSSSPQHYDGEAWHEADFHTAPDLGFSTSGVPTALSTQVALGGAGAIPNGSYIYAAWYETQDAQGEVHRGPVGVKFLFTVTGGPQKVTLTIPTCRLSRFGNVRICIARSEVGATGTDASIPLYRITDVDPTVSTGDNRFVVNDFTVDTVTFTDNLTDIQVRAREPLYTNGGVLSNAPASWSGEVIAAGKNRIFWLDSTDQRIVRFSQLLADDVALQAPVDLALRVDQAGGPVTAIAIMDDGVYPLCDTAVFVFSGPGPDDSGTPVNGGFSPSDIVTTDAGCSSSGSVCDTPVGVMFQSRKGIVLLGRDRQLRDVGTMVSGYDSQTVSRMTLLPDRQSVIALTASGRSLLWDYRRNQWSTFTNHEGLDAVVVDNTYHYLRNDSRVFRETRGAYRDDNQQIPMLIETAQLHFAQFLQSWQRIIWAMFLGEWKSPHTLRVRFRLDYNTAYSAPIDIDVNSNWNPSLYGVGPYGVGAYGGPGLDGTRYQRSLHINRRCQSISFQISDVEALGDAGASFELSELLIVGGVLSSRIPIGAARAGGS